MITTQTDLKPVEWGSLYYGDCLDVMAEWAGGQADLIYLDPPFNSDQDYNVLYGTDEKTGRTAQQEAFGDTWKWDDAATARLAGLEEVGVMDEHISDLAGSLRKLLPEGGMLAYLTYMAERLIQCHKVLKPSGSIYLHCDDTAAHWLKVVMDSIFGPTNYLNDITWRRSIGHYGADRYGRICDHILFYSKDRPQRYWNGKDRDAGTPKTPEMLGKSYPSDDNDGRGRYRADNLTGAKSSEGESGRPWNGYEVYSRDRHWAAPLTGDYAEWIEKNIIPGYRKIKGVHARLDALDDAGMIHHPSKEGGWPGLKRYAAADSGRIPPQSLILDPIGWTNFNKTDEYLDYDTQKPIGLLIPMVAAACPPDGTVLDPFCGCGTTVAAAQRLGRKWAGIDIGIEALRITAEERLRPGGAVDVPIRGIPKDLEAAKRLAKDDPFEFEKWIVREMPGLWPNDKQRGDGGVDGRGRTWPDKVLVVAQATASTRPPLSKIRDFAHVISTTGAAVGVFLTLDYKPTPEAKKAARSLGVYQPKGSARSYPKMLFYTAQELLDSDKPPPDLPPMADARTGGERRPSLFDAAAAAR